VTEKSIESEISLGDAVKTPCGKIGNVVSVIQPESADPILMVHGDDFLMNVRLSQAELLNAKAEQAQSEQRDHSSPDFEDGGCSSAQ